MTCIVGLVDKGVVYMGGDSAVSCGSTVDIMTDSKVFKRGPYLIGVSGSIRVSNVIRYQVKLPAPPDNNRELTAFMSTKFADALRDALKVSGCKEDRSGIEEFESGAILVGVKGRLFWVCRDFSTLEMGGGCDAIGSGANWAMGALFATKGKSPKIRIKVALEAAARYCATVAGPFTIKSVKI